MNLSDFNSAWVRLAREMGDFHHRQAEAVQEQGVSVSGKKEKLKRRVERLYDVHQAAGPRSHDVSVRWVAELEEDRARRIKNARENKRAIAATLARLGQ